MPSHDSPRLHPIRHKRRRTDAFAGGRRGAGARSRVQHWASRAPARCTPCSRRRLGPVTASGGRATAPAPAMPRFGRLRLAAFGLVSLFNVLGLLVRGRNLSAAGSSGLLHGSEASRPAVLLVAAACLGVAAMAAVRRGRDLGWPALVTLAFCVVGLGTGPGVLLLALYLAFARSNPGADAYGAPAPAVGLSTGVSALASLVGPWMAALALGRIG